MKGSSLIKIARSTRIKINSQQTSKPGMQRVTIITCTNRPQFRENILANFLRQNYVPKELIIILNSNCMNLEEWKEWAMPHSNIRIFQLDEEITQGECLNFAVQQSESEYVAKFDDDDYYAPQFLQEQMEAFEYTDAKVVGKASWFIYFEDSKNLAIFYPQHENCYTEYLHGATLLIKRDVFEHVLFRHRSLGEDTYFINDCIEKGILIYSIHRFNFVGMRRQDPYSHTWQEGEEAILRRCEFIAQTDDYLSLTTL